MHRLGHQPRQGSGREADLPWFVPRRPFSEFRSGTHIREKTIHDDGFSLALQCHS